MLGAARASPSIGSKHKSCESIESRRKMPRKRRINVPARAIRERRPCAVLRRSKRPVTKRGFNQRVSGGRIFRLLRSSTESFDAIYDAVRKSSPLKSKSAPEAHRAVSNALNNLQARGLVVSRSRRYAIVRPDAGNRLRHPSRSCRSEENGARPHFGRRAGLPASSTSAAVAPTSLQR